MSRKPEKDRIKNSVRVSVNPYPNENRKTGATAIILIKKKTYGIILFMHMLAESSPT